MKSDKWEERLSAYIDGLNEKKDMDHEMTDGDEEWFQLTETVNKLKNLEQIEWPDDSFVDQVSERLKLEQQKMRKRRWPKLATAAAVLAIAIVGSLQWQGMSDKVIAKNLSVIKETKLTELTGSPGIHPSFIPGERTVTFEQDDKIWILERVSQPRVLIDENYAREPVWSPDGKRIAYVGKGDNGSYGIWVADRDGSNRIRLTNPGKDTTAHEEPAWSPDGKWIAFTENVRESNDPHGFTVTRQNIWLMKADGTDAKQVTNGYHPRFSPDGGQLVFNRPAAKEGEQPDIWTVNVDGTSELKMAQGKDPVWSPDGQFLLFVKTSVEKETIADTDGKSKYSAEGYKNEIWVHNIINGKETQITKTSLSKANLDESIKNAQNQPSDLPTVFILPSMYDDYTPAWSSDGNSIVFARNTNDPQHPRFSLYQVELQYK